MSIEDYKQADGYYMLPGDPCSYMDADDLLQVGVFGFCMCGRPEDNLWYILGGLELINDRGPDGIRERDAWDIWWKARKERELAHFGKLEAAYFFYYWADKEELTEHGGSVPGWLTEKGDRLLAELRELKASYDDGATDQSTERT